MNVRKNALRAASVGMVVAGLTMAGPALAQEADLVVSGSGPETGNVGLGMTGDTTIKVTNAGSVSAAEVTLSLDTSAWPEDQTISAIDGCIPATEAPKKNADWFPCTIATATSPLKTEADVTKPATTNAKSVVITIQYGAELSKADFYNDDGTKKGAWTCPAADRFKPLLASMTTSTKETNTANNSYNVDAPQALWADLEVTLIGPSSVGPSGGEHTFDFTVTNHGPCTVSPKLVRDRGVSTGFEFVSGAGICASLTDDKKGCAISNLAPGATSTGQKVYRAPSFPSELLSSNQGTGVLVTGVDYSDPNSDNDVSDVTYVVKNSTGCSSVGGGAPAFLIGLGLAALFVRRSGIA